MADLRELFDAFDRLVAAASDVDVDAAEAAGRVGARERRRRGYLGNTVVIALAGGTGSGKSSLVNALAGEEIALTGPQRPTTSAPLAWIPSNPEPGLVRLLDDMEVAERIGHDELDWLAVLDLPDMDSVAESHRATVERLLPEVDAIVWVVDPEKYQDRLLHDEYLKPLAAHAARFRFVVNQIDRIPNGELAGLIDDLGDSLTADGIPGAVISATAADPPLGPPVGIDEFVDDLRTLGDAKRVINDRIVDEIAEAASRLVSRLGVETGGGTGFTGRWDAVRADASEAIAGDLLGPRAEMEIERAGSTAGRRSLSLIRPEQPPTRLPLALPPETGPGRRHAVERIDALVASLADSLVGEVKSGVRRVRSEIEDAVTEGALAVVVESSLSPGEPPAWWGLGRLIRWVGLVALIVGAVGLFDALRADRPLVVWAAILIGGLAALGVPRMLASRSGSRWARQGLADVRSTTASTVARELDRRIGRPLRDSLRLRAGVGSAYLEVSLLLRDLRRG